MRGTRRWLRRAGGVGGAALGLAVTSVAPVPATAAPGGPLQEPPETPSVTRTVLRLPDGQETFPYPEGDGTVSHVAPRPQDINDHGQVVGMLSPGPDPHTPLLWETDVAEALPGGDLPSNDAVRINDRGQVALVSHGVEVGDHGHAYLWRDGAVTELPPGYEEVVDLNEAGQVLLKDLSGDADDTSAVWSGDGRTSVIRKPSDTGGPFLVELSDAGVAVGHTAGSVIVPGCTQIYFQPYIWRAGTVIRPELSGRATGVNRAGQVVLGVVDGCGRPTAPYGYLWEDGEMTELGFYPRDINDRGQIVGDADGRALVWEDGRRTELGTLGGATVATQLNEVGQVVGTSEAPDGFDHAFVWTSGHMIDLGVAHDVQFSSGYAPFDINDRGQLIGYHWGDPATLGDRTAALWQVHDPNVEYPDDPPDPPEAACVRATNAEHVRAGRATSWLVFTWAAGSRTYLGTTAQTTTLRETASGRWELVDSC